MATVGTIDGDMIIRGKLVVTEDVALPSGCVDDDDVAADAGLDADKLERRISVSYGQDDGSDVVAAIAPVHIARAAGTLQAVQVVCVDAPTGADREITVDIQKADEGSPSPATILTAVVTIDDETSDCEVLDATIDSATIDQGDTLFVVVAVAGSAGDQGQGLIVTLTLDENASPS